MIAQPSAPGWAFPSPLRAIAKAALAALLFAAQPVAYAAEDWALLAREGGCHPIASLKRRLADLPEVRDPDAFQAYVQAKGWRFDRKAHAVPAGKAVEFAVESQGLALLFVTREMCSSGPEAVRR
ncbi:MAG TPA: hypothetical protein PKD04_03735 [Rhodocyclaceae bacterium]|nr:hypothetical protein [Rhodocyclaceae bacterium]HMV22525.1 hypothetical protein [Rhodocyclaceae bacterium]HMW78031.1 hypothetical protein [Rhodocyclaceae bacterium]HNE44148.1 hypothetical protein [Rhodocyclaceae bacterium]HNM21892.1 hypothetical protein [Rhodocyclaceae bacterium]